MVSISKIPQPVNGKPYGTLADWLKLKYQPDSLQRLNRVSELNRRVGALQHLLSGVKLLWQPGMNTAEPCDKGNCPLVSLSVPELAREAYHGFVGDFVTAISRYTEATDPCILGQLLPAVASIIGPKPYIYGGNDQPARIGSVIVGSTSNGRKGTGLYPVERLIGATDSDFRREQRINNGLSSGEGLLHRVKDIVKKDYKTGKETVVPRDKRLWVVEQEFSKVLAQTKREGNTLSMTMRNAFDSGDFDILTKDPIKVRGAHICFIGHITPEELNARFNEVEMANGFGNRFLWFSVHSDKIMPNPTPIPDKLIQAFSVRLDAAIRFAARRTRMEMNSQAAAAWADWMYPELRKENPGLTGVLTARGESIVLRLALIYALLDQCFKVKYEHLQAAFAVWNYSTASVQGLFKRKRGSGLADRIYKKLDEDGPMETKEIYQHFSGKGEGTIKEALAQLEKNGEVRSEKVKRAGRGAPAYKWVVVE